ncbi:MAG: hypothetical protein EP330_02910 [Deltaproteobacteria bacterium]|nr:MAG: hypothetical protein EP330_02910 [Deltaproteobacteria bacterium]
MNKFTLAMAVGMLALTACTEGDPDPVESDTETETVYEGPWQTTGFSWSCDTTDGSYTYTVNSDGWADAIDLDIVETGAWGGLNDPNTYNGWDEFHTLSQGQYADDGSWDTWGATLTKSSTTGGVVSGESTFFTCGTHGEAELAWMATSDFGENGADCAVYGNEAADYYNTHSGNSCTVLQ